MTCCGVDIDFPETTSPGNFLPVPDNTWTLGDATHRWKELFIGHSPITISGKTGFLAGNTVGLIRMDDDSKVLVLSGSDAASDVGGAYIVVGGDTSGRTGQVQIFGSSTAVGSGAGDIDLHCMGPLAGVTVWTQDLQRWAWNAAGDLVQSSGNGGNLVIQRAGYGALIGTSTLPDATILSAFGTYPALLSITNPTSYAAGVVGAFGANSSGPQFSGFKTRSASSSAPATSIVQAGDNLFTLSGYGADGVAYKIGGSIVFQASDTPALNSIPTDILFNVVKSGGTSQTQIARTFSNGVFGVTSVTSLDTDLNNFGPPASLIVANNNTLDGFVNLSNGNNATGAHFYGVKTRSSGTDANTIINNGDELAVWGAYGSDGATYRIGAKLAAVSDGAPAAAVMPTRLEVHTAITNGTLRRWYFDSNGKFIQDTTNGAGIVMAIAGSNLSSIINGAASLDSDASAVLTNHVPFVSVQDTSNSAPNLALIADGNGTDGAQILTLKTRSASPNTDANTAVQSGDVLLQITAYGSDGADYRSGIDIRGVVDGSVAVNSLPTRLEFRTKLTSSLLRRYYIDSVGDFFGDSTNQGNFWLPQAKPGTKTFALGVSSLDSDVSGAFGTPGFVTLGNNNSGDNVVFIGNGNNAVGSHIYGVKTRSTGGDANTAVVNNDEVVNFGAYASDGTSYRNVGSVRLLVDGALGTRIPSRMEFTVANTSGTFRAWYIDSAGVLNGDVSNQGHIIFNRNTKTVQLTQGSNGKAGTVVLNGVTPVTVGNTSITAGSTIIFTLKTVGGTVGAYPAIQTITPGTGFTVSGTALDTSTYNYSIIETA